MPGYNRLQPTILGANFVEMVQIQGTLLRLCVHAAVRCTQLFPAACKICKKKRNECTGGKLPAAMCQTRLRRMWLLAPDKTTRCLKMADKLHGTAWSKSPFCFWVGVLTHRDGVRAEWHRSPWQEECYQHFGVRRFARLKTASVLAWLFMSAAEAQKAVCNKRNLACFALMGFRWNFSKIHISKFVSGAIVPPRFYCIYQTWSPFRQ